MRSVHVYTDKMWRKLEDKVQPVNGILFTPEGVPAPTDLASPPRKPYKLDKDKTIDDVKDQEPEASPAEDPAVEVSTEEVQEQEEQKPKRKARRRRKTGFVHNY